MQNWKLTIERESVQFISVNSLLWNSWWG